jgi:hypothetical protein
VSRTAREQAAEIFIEILRPWNGRYERGQQGRDEWRLANDPHKGLLKFPQIENREAKLRLAEKSLPNVSEKHPRIFDGG